MIPLTILHEDETLIAVEKPAGLATANVPAHEESVFSVVRQMLARGHRRGGPAEGAPFVGVVSRLDKPVSGVVVLAKTKDAAASLAEQFRERRVEKTYFAICEGRFPAAVGRWVDWTDTVERDSDATSGGSPKARLATLRARVVRRFGEVSLVELEPLTGRRHQLRAQLAARGCPIVGDRLYKARLPFPDGIALHASRLLIRHPSTGRPLELVSAFPGSWRPRFAPLLADIPRTGR